MNIEQTTTDGPYIIDIDSYGFHLLSGTEGEEPFTLLVDYEGEEAPSQEEIEDYIYHQVKGYALSRWFERVLFGFGAPGIISPIHHEDWSGEKMVRARGGECPLYFIENFDEFGEISGIFEGKDVFIVYVGDLNIGGSFLPFINQVIDVMREEKNIVFKSKERKEGVSIQKMLTETPMTFAVRPGGLRGLRMDASKIKGHISYKIMERIRESMGKKGVSGRKVQNQGGVRGVQGTVGEKVGYNLRI